MYLFGWSGVLSFKARKKASQRLYGYIRQIRNNKAYDKTPVTIITVSHGGNVGLGLGGIAEEYHDTTPGIDRLVILCCPVQEATSNYVNSPIFKKVFHLYSSHDLVQVLDPQGLYSEPDAGCPTSLLSTRTFPHVADNVIQADIRWSRKASLSHIDFALAGFQKQLPALLELLADSLQRKQLPKNSLGTYSVDLAKHQKALRLSTC
jgi:hypothetical protein